MGRHLALVSGRSRLDIVVPKAQPRGSFESGPSQNFQLLTASFSRVFPVPESHCFGDILTAIDEALTQEFRNHVGHTTQT